ncbi:hypothetical protein SSX86_023011 [Deinandra increscens subsp. villosa]|uniref:Uncharacterized protein n=1 Tax=Deinandra increscens subsp. villosa TaxID=3103831 RepID=A0AAP0GQV1_9ASTR
MFYSHNLLARKGPLGTVWCAAHLQGRLKKSNYITINIPSTVEQIMNPQVPIALRMSSHLLLGVVRIYSKKVEYLQHDYNVLRIDISKAYANADINLPEDANQARYESITLPDNFALDLIDIDDNVLNGYAFCLFYSNFDPFHSYDLNHKINLCVLIHRSLDTHIRPNEDISFTDHSPASFSKNRHETPAGYITIYVGEDASRSPSIFRDTPRRGSVHVEENVNPHTPPPTIHGVEDPDPNHHLGSSDIFINVDNVSPPENLRNYSNLQKSPLVSLVLPDMVEPDPELVKEIDNNNNNNSLSNLNDILDNAGPSSPPKPISPQEFVHFEHDPVQDSSAPQVLFELAPSSPRVRRSAERAPSPPRANRRRIKYDQATVFSNKFMQNVVNDDASRLRRKRKGTSSFLGVYRLNNAHKKQKVLFDPVITGLCDNLHQLHEDENVSSKAQLINTEQADPGPVEVGRFRDFAELNDNNMIPMSSPDNNIPFSSPRTVDQNTPAFSTDVGYTPAISTDVGTKSYQAPTTLGTSVGPTPDPASSVASFMSDMETPFPQSQPGFDNSGGLYDIAEVDDDEELAFMEDDEGTPGLMGTPGGSSLLPRTRCVAKLIKEKSAATPSTSENLGSVSMKSILERKTRKVCSRMFFETLVLKSCDFIDVKQDQPYGDITLEVTPKLSKLDFSN